MCVRTRVRTRVRTYVRTYVLASWLLQYCNDHASHRNQCRLHNAFPLHPTGALTATTRPADLVRHIHGGHIVAKHKAEQQAERPTATRAAVRGYAEGEDQDSIAIENNDLLLLSAHGRCLGLLYRDPDEP